MSKQVLLAAAAATLLACNGATSKVPSTRSNPEPSVPRLEATGTLTLERADRGKLTLRVRSLDPTTPPQCTWSVYAGPFKDEPNRFVNILNSPLIVAQPLRDLLDEPIDFPSGSEALSIYALLEWDDSGQQQTMVMEFARRVLPFETHDIGELFYRKPDARPDRVPQPDIGGWIGFEQAKTNDPIHVKVPKNKTLTIKADGNAGARHVDIWCVSGPSSPPVPLLAWPYDEDGIYVRANEDKKVLLHRATTLDNNPIKEISSFNGAVPVDLGNSVRLYAFVTDFDGLTWHQQIHIPEVVLDTPQQVEFWRKLSPRFR